MEKPKGIEFEVKSRCHILKPFKFEWVMHSQFEKEARKSSEEQFKPYVKRTFLDSMQENLTKGLYL